MARATSLAAYHAIRDSLAPGLRRKIYAVLVEAQAPMTSSEIAKALGVGQQQIISISPRMQEMKDRDLIEEVGERECSVTGRNKIVFRPTGSPEKKPDPKVVGPTRKRLLELLDIAHDGLSLALQHVEGEDATALWELRETIERETGMVGTNGGEQ